MHYKLIWISWDNRPHKSNGKNCSSGKKGVYKFACTCQSEPWYDFSFYIPHECSRRRTHTALGRFSLHTCFHFCWAEKAALNQHKYIFLQIIRLVACLPKRICTFINLISFSFYCIQFILCLSSARRCICACLFEVFTPNQTLRIYDAPSSRIFSHEFLSRRYLSIVTIILHNRCPTGLNESIFRKKNLVKNLYVDQTDFCCTFTW